MSALLASGWPLQYVLGRWSFHGIELLVDARALIPRPETEHLVELVLGRLGGRRKKKKKKKEMKKKGER